jgi:hypothetical protein
MSVENPLWGAPRIHGELLKLGFEVAQSNVAKYMVKRRAPSQGWRTFLHNHAPLRPRLKLVRRQMYGRGNIDLLQARLIGAE